MSEKFWMSLEQAENPKEFAKTLPGEFTSSPIRIGNENDTNNRNVALGIPVALTMFAAMAIALVGGFTDEKLPSP